MLNFNFRKMKWYDIFIFMVIIIINAYLKPLMYGNNYSSDSTSKEYKFDRLCREKKEQILQWFVKRNPFK